MSVDSSIDKLIICKPKKSDNNTYICNIWNETIKTPYILDLDHSIIVEKKKIHSLNFIYLKNKAMYNYFYDLNAKIVEIVKSNCGEWFNNNMNIDLIDDYYTNTLIYDKTYGDIIKLSCINNDIINENTKCNIRLHLQNLRFYKQKFVLECSIEQVETVSEFIEDDFQGDKFFEEDEMPQPTNEELESMKNEYIERGELIIERHRRDISVMQEKIASIETLIDNLNKIKTIDNILNICNNNSEIFLE